MAKKNQPDKLARDAAAALAAGMSYGRWKAMQPAARIEQKKPAESYVEHTCAYCGCKFIRYDRKVQKYCGYRCKYNATTEAKRDKLQEDGAE